MRRLLLVALMLAGCRTAEDFRTQPPDEVRTYPGELHSFESAMLARHSSGTLAGGLATMVDVTTPIDRASDAVALWGVVRGMLGNEGAAFLLTARQCDPESLLIEVRVSHSIWPGATEALLRWPWGYVEDCLGPSLDSGPRKIE